MYRFHILVAARNTESDLIKSKSQDNHSHKFFCDIRINLLFQITVILDFYDYGSVISEWLSLI